MSRFSVARLLQTALMVSSRNNCDVCLSVCVRNQPSKKTLHFTKNPPGKFFLTWLFVSCHSIWTDMWKTFILRLILTSLFLCISPVYNSLTWTDYNLRSGMWVKGAQIRIFKLDLGEGKPHFYARTAFSGQFCRKLWTASVAGMRHVSRPAKFLWVW